MLNENSYELTYIAKQKNRELTKMAERNRRINEAVKEKNSSKAVITQILEGTGKVLINTGNKLLEIA